METTAAPKGVLRTIWSCKGALVRLLATACLSGYLPLAPGSWAALLTLILAYLFLSSYWLWQFVTIFVIFFLGVWASSEGERFYGHDGRVIVIDEVAGMLVGLFLVPKRVVFYLAAFILFRFLDIVKPPPSRRLECLPGGWGVMADDFLAGLYACVSIQFLLLVLRS